MIAMKNKSEQAVSPVVGVMLMLVVTIIVAAVVSAFAGGLSAGTSKTPQMSIKASFSNSTGMTISHQGGDTVNTLSTKFVVSPSGDFGSYNQLRWTINSSVISVSKSDGNRPWFDPSLSTSKEARTFQSGETATISVDNLSQVQRGTYTTTTDASSRPTDAFSSYYGFMNPSSLGQRFNLQLVDDNGKTIAQTEVSINP
jgi:FlaG/FlaF family flagellin (archaellin)